MEIFVDMTMTESEKVQALQALQTPALIKYLRLLATAAAVQTVDFDVNSVSSNPTSWPLQMAALRANGSISCIRELLNEAETPSALRTKHYNPQAVQSS